MRDDALMTTGSRTVAATCWATASLLACAAPADAQTGGLDAPSLWLLLASLAQIVLAAALVIFLIMRGSRPCANCGRRVSRNARKCPNCGTDPRGASSAKRGR